MAVTVILDIFPQDKKVFLVFTDNDFDFVHKNWNKNDVLLAELKKHKVFEGCDTWADLKPSHYKFLVTRNLVKFLELDPNNQDDETNPVNKSLHFLIMALVKCIEDNAELNIELLKINYFDADNVSFDVQASIQLTIMDIKNNLDKKIDLKIVVDNTRND